MDDRKPGITLLEKIKIQTEVIIPILNTLREESGNDNAIRIVAAALRGLYEKQYEGKTSSLEGDSLARWTALNTSLTEQSGGQVEIEFGKKEKGLIEFRAKRCRYAEFFRQLSECELGTVMCCEIDHHIARAAGPGVGLFRERTIMQGDEFCDFRYSFADE